ncbi:diguanylate cyclase [Sulfuricurvum sp.]|uniref:sensor domain-containing diguanylate cyclase n=1 Tax=Sulfuricurvum sp. TaxID=2025608 RepID=UPI00261CFD6C|nr:diguanylate cyclase [Sulfuricurvum sp.]MDD2781314.1 diguanylate cyclase [Sulfuricurvum sp.]
MQHWSTKNKTLIFVTTILLLFAVVLLGSIYWEQKKELKDNQETYAHTLQTTYDKIVEKRNQVDYTDAMININSRNIKKSIINQDRKTLFDLTVERWKALKQGNKHLSVMHFHLSDGTALLRMHAPKKYGDNVASFRPMIANISKYNKEIHGFETGIHNLAYRSVIPIFEDKRYIGALELGSRPDIIFDEMEYYSGLKGALFVKNNNLNLYKNETLRIGDYSLQYDSANNKPLLDQLAKIDYPFPMLYRFHFNDQSYAIYSFDVHDYAGKVVAKAVFVNDITAIENQYAQKMIENATYLFILVFLIIFIIELGFQNLIQKLEDTNDQLHSNQKFLHSIVDTSRDGIALLDAETNFLFFNKAYLEMSGFTNEEMLKQSCAGLSAPEDLPRALSAIDQVYEKGFIDNFEKTCIVKDGKKLRVNMSITLMPDKERFLVNVRDITESSKLEKLLQDRLTLIDKNIITSSTDLNGNILETSEAFCRISGYTREELIGKNHRIVHHPDMPKTIYKELWESIKENKVWRGELKNRTKDGGYYWVDATIYPIYDDEGRKIGYTAIRQDISDKKRLEEIAITDALTGIYNRRHFNTLFPRFLSSAKRNSDFICFAIMDVDHFKDYNDTYGHQKGDEVLIQVAHEIKKRTVRADDYCFRLGGEEFGLIFRCDDLDKSLLFVNSIREGIENLSIEHCKNSVAECVTISIGLICINGSLVANETHLYAAADKCLYQAKAAGRNRVVLGESHSFLLA